MGKHREFFVVGMYYYYVKDTLILFWSLFLKSWLTLCCAGITRAQGQWGSKRSPHGKEVHLVKRRGKNKKNFKKGGTKLNPGCVEFGNLEIFHQKYISGPLVFWGSSVNMTFKLFTLQLSPHPRWDHEAVILCWTIPPGLSTSAASRAVF